MHVIVAGCGRVGASLAETLDDSGHAVTVIDQDRQAFDRLPEGFSGTTIAGLVFDRATLLRAGVAGADAFVALTSGDNSNIVSARTARQHFGVATVVARIYDPARAEIYERHGITTIATTRWTADSVLEQLLPKEARIEAAIGPGEGDVVVLTHDLPTEAGPWEIEQLTRQGRWLVGAVTRTGQTTIPVPRQLVQSGERIHLLVQRTAVAEAEAFLADLAAGGPAAGRRPQGRA
ncbi:TrkA family potassium uptake protein [soil metagenome]